MNEQVPSKEQFREKYIRQLREWCGQGGLTPFPLGLAQAIESFLTRTAPEPPDELSAWLHTMHYEPGNGCDRRLSFNEKHPFGEPGKNYSAEYQVTSEPLYRAAQPPRVSPWIKVTHRLPESGVPVLAFVTNEQGKTRRIRAQWCAKFTEESDGDDAEYCEEKDTYYSPEGWYESNEYDEVNWFVHDPVSHWMPLPEGPTATKESDHG